MTGTDTPSIKLRYLKVQNFKALDFLEMEFPPPRMTEDPDILVIGSRNGLGKTSVLEACVLLYSARIEASIIICTFVIPNPKPGALLAILISPRWGFKTSISPEGAYY